MVHTFDDYGDLALDENEGIGESDFFCQVNNKSSTGEFDSDPTNLERICKCDEIYNPDKDVIQCGGRNSWVHLDYMGTTLADAKVLDPYLCQICVGSKEISIAPSEAKHETNNLPLRRLFVKFIKAKETWDNITNVKMQWVAASDGAHKSIVEGLHLAQALNHREQQV
ncbi:OLC1v1001512C1 [Oldenlandia corymbosa var. corymbosa]|uniref:OLC1v1001512C1 n=1 Tax=Oldenlandia corymbosa var. corymbosa TaxID=529605 RepID=A0AAV1D7Q0_OLDCO|nr:OLC1v1001512C1 [Oldenlandia corymbosa var. corymbosa]